MSSINFSPRGTKLLAIINGKCFLLNVPRNIRCPYGDLVYFILKIKNCPQEICYMIMDYVAS
jgi:hypothetical protein